MKFRFPFLRFNKNRYHSNTNISVPQKKESNSESDSVFNIFGIRLHSDDILLLSLIFFLYNENVDDSNLFVALILLLLS